MRALLLEDIVQHSGLRARFGISIETNHIVEIAGACAVTQGADLFTEGFLIGVAPDSDALFQRIAIVVKNFTL